MQQEGYAGGSGAGEGSTTMASSLGAAGGGLGASAWAGGVSTAGASGLGDEEGTADRGAGGGVGGLRSEVVAIVGAGL